jgi:hypothetical protein
VASAPLGITGVDDSPGMLRVLDIGADAAGPSFLFAQTLGGAANQTMSFGLARLGGAPTTVYMSGDNAPDGVGLYGDGAGHACAMVSAGSASYVQCEGGSQMATGLGSIATPNGFATSRIVSAAASDGTLEFFTYGPFAAIYGVTLSNGAFSPVEFFESSVSFPGAAAAAGGFPYACIVGSDNALAVVGPSRVVARTGNAMTYQDCRMASDGTQLHVIGVADVGSSYAAFTPPALGGPSAAAPLDAQPLAIDVSGGPYAIVFFAGKPQLVRRNDANGNVELRAIASGALGDARVLVAGTDDLAGAAAVGPDGGLHLVTSAGGHLAYAKRCP